MGSFTAHFKDWASQPFSEDMPATHWFLLVGLIIVSIIGWNFILAHLFNAVRSN